jgi:hypothetical protein
MTKVGFTPEKKTTILLWKNPQSPRTEKPRQVRSSTKSMLIVPFDVKGIVNREFVPPNTTVNSDFSCGTSRRLKENMRRKRPDFGAITTGSFITATCVLKRP